MSERYRQCRLRHGSTEMTAWLPEYHGMKAIRPGVQVTLKDTDDRLWTVENVFGPEQDISYLHRKRSERVQRISTTG